MSLELSPWRKRLQRGRFRDVEFYVDVVQTQVGRRVALHEYPQRDTAYPEDLGQKADAFTIEALVIGPDYIPARDALIAALKKRGPGTLIHPYYGQRTVTLASPARIAESPREGGMARFSLDFVEAGENTEPSASADTQDGVENAADAANAAIGDEFAETFGVGGHPAFVESAALTNARAATTALEEARRSLVPDRGILSDYNAAVTSVMGSLTALLREPAAFAQEVLGLVGTLKALAAAPDDALNSYRGMFDYGTADAGVPATTPSRRVQGANQNANAALFRRAALAEGARVASRADYDTYDQAIAVRDELAAALDDEAAGQVPALGGGTQTIQVGDGVYTALTALRVALVRDLTDRAIDAPRVTSAMLPATLPALVAAYRIHGDATRADELLRRNPSIRHPGFVPGGQALEVVSGSKAL